MSDIPDPKKEITSVTEKTPTVDKGSVAEKTPTVDKGSVAEKTLSVERESIAEKTPTVDRGSITEKTPSVDKGSIGRVGVDAPIIVAPTLALQSRWVSLEYTPGAINTSCGPALAEYNGQLYMAYKGSGADTRIWFSVYDGNSWSNPTCFDDIDPIANRRSTSDRPALAVCNDRLYMAWKGGNDQKLYFSYYNKLQWTNPAYAEGADSTCGPALAEYGDALYMAWKGSGADVKIFYARFNLTQNKWLDKSDLSVISANTSHAPALATYKDGNAQRLYLVWKGMTGAIDDKRIWFASMSRNLAMINGRLEYKDNWTSYNSIFSDDEGSSCGPALATYSKYWTRTNSYDPIHKDLYMLWKGGNDSRIYESNYKLKELNAKWTQRNLVAAVPQTSDTPALAEYKGKLFMAWKEATSSRICFSHLDVGTDNRVGNIFDKTRPGTPVVRQEDLAVLRIETRNMKIVPGLRTSNSRDYANLSIQKRGKPQLQRTGAGAAYLILHFPPQAFGEEAFFQAKQNTAGLDDKPLDPPKPEPAGGGAESCDPPVRARIAHESRLVFRVPDDFGDIEYTLAGVLEACTKLPLQVSAATRPEAPGSTTTSIEMPWRLIMSPSSSAYWRHAALPVKSDSTKHTELWHSRMVTPEFDGGKIVEEIMSPYPDERRVLRAIWALSGIGSEAPYNKLSTESNLSIVPMESVFPGSAAFPAPDVNPFRMPLDDFDRYQLAHLTSNYNLLDDDGNPLDPNPLATNMMTLSPLGGWLDVRGAWDTPGLSVEQWSHRATMGRDHFVRVVYKGFLFPFGHRVSLIKISERKFNKTKSDDYAAYLHQRMYLVINEKDRLFNDFDDLFEKIKTTPDGRYIARKFPFKSVKLLTEITPDIDPPNGDKCSVAGNGQKMFWPHVATKPFRFQCVATDLEGRRILFDLPMIFVDATLAIPRGAEGEPRLDYVNAEKFAKDAISAYANANNNINWNGYDTVDLAYQRVALARCKKPGDTSVQVIKMQFGGFVDGAKDNQSLKDFSKELTRPIWAPQAESIEAAIESITNLSGGQGTHKLTFNTEYLKHDLGEDGNKGEVFVDIASGPNLDFSSQGDRAGGFIQPNLKPAALSRLAGPVMGDQTQLNSFIMGTMQEGGGFPLSNDESSGIPLPLVFGCIPLGKLIKSANVGDLKRLPKFISEACSKVASFMGDLGRVYELVTGLPKQAASITVGALTAFNETLQDLIEQAATYGPEQMNPVVSAINLTVSNGVSAISYLSNLLNQPNQPNLPNLHNLLTGVGYTGYSQAVAGLKNAVADNVSLPAGFKQSVRNAANKLGYFLEQLELAVTLADMGENLCGELFDIVGNPQNTAAMLTKPAVLVDKLTTINTKTGLFSAELKKADFLDGAPRNLILTALDAVAEILSFPQGIAKLVEMLTGDELTIRFDWNPEIKNWSLDGSSDIKHQLFRANDKNGLLVAVEAKVKKNGASSPKISVNCSLKHFDLVLIAPASFIELNFEKIEFSVDTAAKMDVDVLLSDIKFVGPLSFVETLRDLIPLNGFSDPPYLDITSKGIDAGYTVSLPSICCGMLNIANLSLSAGFTVPFIGEPLSVRFNFCKREQPFLLTVYGLGGGGFFGITIDPSGVQILEASLEFGAALAVDFGVARGEVHVMAGMYFRMEKDEASLTGYFRLGGSVSVLGLITASIEMYLGLTYEFSSGKCVGRAQLTVEVSVLFFSTKVTINCERKIAGSNGDPTFRQMFGYQPDLPLSKELGLINDNTEYPWREYVEAFVNEEVV